MSGWLFKKKDMLQSSAHIITLQLHVVMGFDWFVTLANQKTDDNVVPPSCMLPVEQPPLHTVLTS